MSKTSERLRVEAKAAFRASDPYTDLSKIGNGKDGVVRIIVNAAGNAFDFEDVPEEEQLRRLPKKPKTNKRGNRFL